LELIEATLPAIPAGYYITPCKDPEGPCIGWHCYMHGGWMRESGDPFQPTGEFYCDGSSCITLAWEEGVLAPLVMEEDGTYVVDPVKGPLLTNGKSVFTLIE
jgi:hypothetical protein